MASLRRREAVLGGGGNSCRGTESGERVQVDRGFSCRDGRRATARRAATPAELPLGVALDSSDQGPVQSAGTVWARYGRLGSEGTKLRAFRTELGEMTDGLRIQSNNYISPDTVR